MIQNYSLHHLVESSVYPFSPTSYSRFKFGETRNAKQFAEELFNGFILNYQELILSQEEIILFPSPFHSIPTASNYLCHYFKRKLNRFLFEHNKKACIEGKIHRNQTYTEDYGSMDFEARLNLISKDTYYIDREFVDGKFCIFLDDIKITGSHEKTVCKILNDFKVNGFFLFLYFAELKNKDIHPNIENHYNYFDLKSISDLLNIISSNTFYFNTRVIKYILQLKPSEFSHVIQSISPQKNAELLDLSISNNYHLIPKYSQNILTLKNKKEWLLTYKKDSEKQLMLQNLPLD